MKKPRNPLVDCLRILAVFMGFSGVYLLYKLFELAGPTLTSRDIRFLLVISLAILVLALVVLFVCLVLFLFEWWLRLLLQLRKLKSPDYLASENERLRHLELVMVSALDRMENRLFILENKVGEERTLPVRSPEISPEC
ncbi:MAG: hypothetical protein L0Y56_08140 [Nitrospira sp.]|nr:hypothetical protein [Nitrospira sp.]